MRAVVSSLTALAIFLHAVLGCCVHHAHASGPARPVVGTCGCHSHGDGDSHKQGGQESPRSGPLDDGCPSEKCDEASCAFAVAGKVSVEKAWFQSAALDATITPIAQQFELLQRPEITHDPTLSEPVRIHLLHQILLI